MRHWVVIIALTIAAGLPVGAAGLIADSGKACCVIVVPDDATSGEEYAAKELVDHVRQISGVELRRIAEGAHSPAMGPIVSIGRTRLSRKFVSEAQLSDLGDDGYCIFSDGGNAYFVGGRRWGAMYGVYEYLESLGVRWYSPDYTVIPKLALLGMPTSPIRYKPHFWYRHQWWNNGFTAEWLARMRINGNNGQVLTPQESMGGSITAMHGCHSYHILVPPHEHFDKHPEWFAIKENGARSQGELCLTNSELREFVAQRVLADLSKAGGKIDNYWVSQNDGGGSGCFCEKCTAERVAHGGKDRWAANTTSFAGYVAENVAAQFPRIHIKTLAYNYTQAAPENMTTPDSLLVEICGNFSDKDTKHSDLVRSWSKLAKNISVYTYGGSNYGYWWPCPNLHDMGMQCPWAKEAGVRAFYMQGTALGKGSGMVDLRAYLTARMAWNPSRDVKKEIRDFCAGFYGPAGKYIVEYLEWYPAYVEQHKLTMNAPQVWGDAEAWRKWVTTDAMDHADKLFQQALAAVKGNPTYTDHVRRAYLEVLWGGIMVNVKPGASLMDKELALVDGADAPTIKAKAKLFGEIMRENGYNMWFEALQYDAAAYPH